MGRTVNHTTEYVHGNSKYRKVNHATFRLQIEKKKQMEREERLRRRREQYRVSVPTSQLLTFCAYIRCNA